MCKHFSRIKNLGFHKNIWSQGLNQSSSVNGKILIYSENAASTDVMTSHLNLNHPVNVAFTSSMFRNPGCNSSFVNGKILRFKIRLKKSILSPHQKQKLLPPNTWKCPFWLAQSNSGRLSTRIHVKVCIAWKSINSILWLVIWEPLKWHLV